MDDDSLDTTWYEDADNDGFGNAFINQNSCTQPVGFINNDEDCDDTDSAENPLVYWWPDVDGDGYGDSQAAGLV